ncbi:hypothetical protein, partial [Tenacibaculum ovolyticum]|uniref:hypothetical protein n=1 Tax=Tenacibaculum ovolyticum TaxID=104270 RepID=UPI000A678254
INSEYTRSRLDHIYITFNNSKPGIVFLFNYGFFSSSLEPNMVNKLFFTFEELKPYLTKDFKKQIES